MEYMQGPGGFYVDDDTAVTLGKFDGLHRGIRSWSAASGNLKNRTVKA